MDWPSGCVLQILDVSEDNRTSAALANQAGPTWPLQPDQLHGRGLPLIAALSDTAAFLDTTLGYVLLRVTRRLPNPGGERAADPAGQ
ncbi:hypothetical protein ACQP00_21010 [Dactylosporangium sp. CS-047395]|uniref:hypothetical protein n=1 Tax=Dactylosporangium sp. CS-047395 TaxID=3239936 RepID=UPI003D8FC5F2